MLEYETLSWCYPAWKGNSAAWDVNAMPTMDTKRDAELNKVGEWETQTAQLPPRISDSCATSAHEDGEKQNPPGSPSFPSNSHHTMSIPSGLFGLVAIYYFPTPG